MAFVLDSRLIFPRSYAHAQEDSLDSNTRWSRTWRLRYRNGYDQPLAWLETGKVYKVALQPMNTSNYFEAGHRLRLEVSSSNFPRFDRNLNTVAWLRCQ